MRKHEDSVYLDADPYLDDCTVEYRTVRLVLTRKPHKCAGAPGVEGADPYTHETTPGEVARVEKALVDGQWAKCYTCLPCLEKYIAWVAEQ